MLPNPPRSHGMASKSTASAATTARAGRVAIAKGAKTSSGRTCVCSARSSCMPIAHTATAHANTASTAKLLIAFPSV